ncbi:hypothetical protein DY000_02019862 [Brassica cretica]|uniref:Uncharacterized protein n=1 Tax=Brassica cretica TaxID=69181 RepID=A0ABQ7CW50_BRACR|nr:hypothetical protein DY000_02019862 [Brassica cretica]
MQLQRRPVGDDVTRVEEDASENSEEEVNKDLEIRQRCRSGANWCWRTVECEEVTERSKKGRCEIG